jgi:glycosyltransferase involved in cell wall biosynthesis
VAVLSSRFESFPNSIIEYLAKGLPIVCTDVGDCREVVENGVNGFIVPVADYTAMANHIIKIFREQLTELKISKNSKNIMKKFLLPKIISEYELIYTDLISTTQ